MSRNLLKKPITNDLREKILRILKSRKSDKILDISRGQKENQILIKTIEGIVSCLITQDARYLYFLTPSGTTDMKALKSVFLREPQ